MIVLVQFLHPWGSFATPTDIASSPVLCSIQSCAALHMKRPAACALDSRSAQVAPTEAAIPVFWGSCACCWANQLAVYGSTLQFLASCGAPSKAYYSRGGVGLIFPNFWVFYRYYKMRASGFLSEKGKNLFFYPYIRKHNFEYFSFGLWNAENRPKFGKTEKFQNIYILFQNGGLKSPPAI